MSKLKAKFQCESITDFGLTKQVSLRAVSSGSEENKDFSKYTPFGELKMSVDSDVPGANFFEPKKEYYLFFEAAE